MSACSEASVIQLLVTALAFLLAVLWLDIYWVRMPQELRDEDIAGAPNKQSWLNAFIALGAAGAGFLLLVWTASCTGTGV